MDSENDSLLKDSKNGKRTKRMPGLGNSKKKKALKDLKEDKDLAADFGADAHDADYEAYESRNSKMQEIDGNWFEIGLLAPAEIQVLPTYLRTLKPWPRLPNAASASHWP